MLFRSYLPTSPLNRFIDNFWLYRGYDAPHMRERILQDATFKIVFNLEQDEFRIYDPWQPGDSSKSEKYSGAIVSRPSGTPFVTDSAEEAHVLGVNFKVGGALAFLGLAANEPGCSHIDLANLWGQQANDLHERLAHELESNNQFRLLERALLHRLSHRHRHHPAVSAALHSLGTDGPASRTREIAKEVGLSQRRVITLFKREVGIAPKLFGRVRRFQRVLEQIRRPAGPHWSALALDCGYFDQSHMIRDFLEFSGLSPAEYLNRQRACAERGIRVKHNHIPLDE